MVGLLFAPISSGKYVEEGGALDDMCLTPAVKEFGRCRDPSHDLLLRPVLLRLPNFSQKVVTYTLELGCTV